MIEIGKSEEEITPPKTVVVHWDSGPRHHYRNGYKTSSLELRKLENESEDIKPFFVKTNFEKTNPSNLLNVGDKVQIVVNIDELKELQEGHGGTETKNSKTMVYLSCLTLYVFTKVGAKACRNSLAL